MQPSVFYLYTVYLIFLVMGFGDAVGPIVSYSKEEYGFSYSLAQLLSFFGFILYGILSIPLALCQYKYGKRKILAYGLFAIFLGFVSPEEYCGPRSFRRRLTFFVLLS